MFATFLDFPVVLHLFFTLVRGARIKAQNWASHCLCLCFISLSAYHQESKQPVMKFGSCKQYNKEISWKEAEQKVCLICCGVGFSPSFRLRTMILGKNWESACGQHSPLMQRLLQKSNHWSFQHTNQDLLKELISLKFTKQSCFLARWMKGGDFKTFARKHQ